MFFIVNELKLKRGVKIKKSKIINIVLNFSHSDRLEDQVLKKETNQKMYPELE